MELAASGTIFRASTQLAAAANALDQLGDGYSVAADPTIREALSKTRSLLNSWSDRDKSATGGLQASVVSRPLYFASIQKHRDLFNGWTDHDFREFVSGLAETLNDPTNARLSGEKLHLASILFQDIANGLFGAVRSQQRHSTPVF